MRARLALAWAGLNPGTVDRLVERHGSIAAVVADLGLESGDPQALSGAGIRFITKDDSDFPPALAGLPDAPRWLFVRGDLPSVDGVAVVGSRRATRYGLELAESIGARLATDGRPVVSGLAAGIDAAAHRGCLSAGGDAIAVLGSGVDVWYPARHRKLGQDILGSGGAVLSEFPPGTPPEAWRFPLRNRIISGLSKIVVVVEAAERSGALITARLAIEQGREVFAVPGDLQRATSRGCNLLIRDGAHPITDLDGLVEMVEFVLGPGLAGVDRSEPPSISGLVLDVPWSLSELIETAAQPASDTLIALGRLEAAGHVRIDAGTVTPT